MTRRCLRRPPIAGVKRAYKLWLYLVEPQITTIPEWAQVLQPKDFERDSSKAWLPRFAAKIIREMDAEEGGKCSVIKVEYKRCFRCRRLTIQLLSEKHECQGMAK